MNGLQFSLSLRLWHPTFHAANLTAEFDLEVEVSHDIKERRRTPKGTILDGVYSETYCCFSLKKNSEGRLGSDLNVWCEYLERHASFLREFVHTGGRLEFYVSIFLDGDRGFEIKNSMFRRICALGLDLSVEMYRLNDKEAAPF